jgi:hypothetical protein
MKVSAKRRRELVKAVNGLKMSKEVKTILIKIAVEVEEAWGERVETLSKENAELKTELQKFISAADHVLRRTRVLKGKPHMLELWDVFKHYGHQAVYVGPPKEMSDPSGKKSKK